MNDSKKNIDNSMDNITVEEMATKTAKPARAKTKSGKAGFFTQLKAEFKKIIWPNRQSLFRQTVAVLITSLCLGIIITLVDLIVRAGLELIIK